MVTLVWIPNQNREAFMRRGALILLLLAVVAGVAGAAKFGGSAKASSSKTTKLTIWVGWGQRELKEFKSVISEYDKAHSDVEVNVRGSINDDQITAAIRSGRAPDVVSSFTSANVGVYCGTGAWIDLSPLLKKSNISMSIFPASTRYYTQFAGKQCALPLLADAHGLYYNKTLFA